MTTSAGSIRKVCVDPWATLAARIVAIRTELDGIATYELQACDPTSENCYDFVPGQFNMLYVPGVGESAISMSGDAHQPESWIHTIRVAGNVTRTLADLKVGDVVGVRGPFGEGWPVAELAGSDVIVAAGGLGLAPLRPLIEHLRRYRSQYGNLTLILGARTPASLLYPEEHDQWRAAGFEIQVTVDRGDPSWKGLVGVATLPLERLALPNPKTTRLVTCGPEVMMKYIALTAVRRGIEAKHIWVSMERNMQCAVGLCGHCQWGSEFVCKDGPVLRYDRVAAYFDVETL